MGVGQRRGHLPADVRHSTVKRPVPRLDGGELGPARHHGRRVACGRGDRSGRCRAARAGRRAHAGLDDRRTRSNWPVNSDRATPASDPSARARSPGRPPRGRPAPSPARAGAATRLSQLADYRVQALAVDELHRVVSDVTVLAHVEDRHDVGMVQPGRGPGFAAEPGQRRAVAAGGEGSTFRATRRPSETCSAS